MRRNPCLFVVFLFCLFLLLHRFNNRGKRLFEDFSKAAFFGGNHAYGTVRCNDQQAIWCDGASTARPASLALLVLSIRANSRAESNHHARNRHDFSALKILRGSQDTISIDHRFDLTDHLFDEFAMLFSALRPS